MPRCTVHVSDGGCDPARRCHCTHQRERTVNLCQRNGTEARTAHHRDSGHRPCGHAAVSPPRSVWSGARRL